MELDPKYSLFYSKKLKLSESQNNETLISREAVIKSGSVSIISLPGIKRDYEEYFDGLESWQTEPLPGFENFVFSCSRKESRADEISEKGKDKIWRMMKEKAEKASKLTGEVIDLEMLTAYQAVWLVMETIREKIKYEYLLLDNVDAYIEIDGVVTTSRKDLVELFADDRDKFEIELRRLANKIDSMRCDEVLEYGFGVCRHIAAIASIMYSVLKERQKGLLLNGAYLLYHGEGVGNNSVVGSHSYNILVVSDPTGEVNLSVIDPTWSSQAGSDPDYTWRRLSQTAYFFNEYGMFFADNYDEIAMDLADQAVKRMVKYFKKHDMIDFLSDYTSLIDQSSIGKKEGTLRHVIKVLKTYGYSKSEALMKICSLPLYVGTYIDGTQGIKPQRFKEVSEHIKTVDFSKDDPFLVIFETLQGTVGARKMEWLENVCARKVNLDEEDLGFFEIALQYVRACVELDEAPRTTQLMQKVLKIFEIVDKYKIDGDWRIWERGFYNLLRVRRVKS